jgi:hypothetical protein
MPDTILDKALSKITGVAAGGDVSSAGTAVPGTASVADLAPKQSFSDFLINYGTLGQASNAQPGYVTPEQQAQADSLASAKAAADAVQQQLTSMSSPAAAPVAAPVATAPPQMISRAGLYELQKQQQMTDYDRKKAEQIAGLRAAGVSDWQLRGATGPTNWGNVSQPANWGKMADYMNTSMVENPYAKTSSQTAAIGGATGTTAASAKAPLSAPPTRPTGRNVSWQQDQQYWRDLDAYNKQQKTGAYR